MKYIVFIFALLFATSCTTSNQGRNVAADPAPPSSSLSEVKGKNSTWLMARYNISSGILNSLEEKMAQRLATGNTTNGNINVFIDMKNILALFIAGGLGPHTWKYRAQYLDEWKKIGYVYKEYAAEVGRRKPGGFYEDKLKRLSGVADDLSDTKAKDLALQKRDPIFGMRRPVGRNFHYTAHKGAMHHASEFDIHMFKGKVLNTGMGPVELLNNIHVEKGGPSIYRLGITGQENLQQLAKQVLDDPSKFHFAGIGPGSLDADRAKVVQDLDSFYRSRQIKPSEVVHNAKFGKNVSASTLAFEKDIARLEKLSTQLQTLMGRSAGRSGDPESDRIAIKQTAKVETLALDMEEAAERIDRHLATAKKSSIYRQVIARANKVDISGKGFASDADELTQKINSANKFPSTKATLKMIGKAAVVPAILIGAGSVLTVSGWRTFMPISRLEAVIAEQKRTVEEISAQLGN